MIKMVLYSVFALAVLATLFILYAAAPAVHEDELANQKIITYLEYRNAEAIPYPRNLKVVSYNIGYASGDKNSRPILLSYREVMSNLAAMVKALSPLDADLLCLQEVDLYSERSLNIDQLDYLAKGLKLPYVAYVIVWNKRYLPWPYWPPTGQFGRIVMAQAVLSRYPIVAQERLLFKKPSENAFWYNWFYPDKAAQKLTIQLGDKTLYLWNIHLEAFRPQARLEQAEELIDYISQEPRAPKLIAGDFNSVSVFRPDLAAARIQELEDRGEALRKILHTLGFHNAEAASPVYSFPSWDPLKKIDHVLYNYDFTLEKSGNLNLTASDHLPVWAEFSLQAP